MPLSLESGFPGLLVATTSLKAASKRKPLQVWRTSMWREHQCTSAPSFSPCPQVWGRNVADVTEGSRRLVMLLNCFSLPASTGFLLLSTCVSRGEHMDLGDLMFHGLLGCQNVLHYYLLQHSRWSSLRKKKLYGRSLDALAGSRCRSKSIVKPLLDFSFPTLCTV